MGEISTWDEVRRIADEVELKIHLASMEARDRWRSLQPKLQEIEQKLAQRTEQSRQTLGDELSSMGDTLRELRDEVVRAFRNERPARE